MTVTGSPHFSQGSPKSSPSRGLPGLKQGKKNMENAVRLSSRLNLFLKAHRIASAPAFLLYTGRDDGVRRCNYSIKSWKPLPHPRPVSRFLCLLCNCPHGVDPSIREAPIPPSQGSRGRLLGTVPFRGKSADPCGQQRAPQERQILLAGSPNRPGAGRLAHLPAPRDSIHRGIRNSWQFTWQLLIPLCTS